MSVETDTPILFFDGVCGLCNHSVDFVLRHDRAGTIRFAPLQGQTAAKLLPAEDTRNLNSVVFQVRGQARRQSTAIACLLREMGGVWSLLGWLLWLVPSPLRNLGYRLVARFRYRMFGQTETCRMPKPEERARFLE